jgi:hypothetical protein
MRFLGFCSALALGALASGAAFGQPAPAPAPASPSTPPALAPMTMPGGPAVMPAPVVAPPPQAGSAIVIPEGATSKLKPPATFLTDCKGLPKGAVQVVPEAVARWATLYCTRNGQLFSSNDTHFSAFPGTGLRGAFLAGELSGRPGERGRNAYFKAIKYEPITAEQARKLEAGLGQAERDLLKDKPLFRIDLTVDTGQTKSMIVVAPDQDPFWVIPIVGDKLNRTGFYVASLEYVNRKR